MTQTNLYNEFVTHKSFGRGQITAQEADCITVSFSNPLAEKKFIFPSCMGKFLVLERMEALKEFKAYYDELVKNNLIAQQDIAERLALEKLAVEKHEKALKKAKKAQSAQKK